MVDGSVLQHIDIVAVALLPEVDMLVFKTNLK